MDHHTSALVHNYDVLVLEENIDWQSIGLLAYFAAGLKIICENW